MARRFLTTLFGKTKTIRNTPRPPARPRLGVEALERRDVPSATANLVSATGELTITGDGAADVVSVFEVPVFGVGLVVSGVSSLKIDGAATGTLPTQLVRSIKATLGGGNDSISVTRSMVLSQPWGGQMSNPFLGVLGSIRIDAGAGNDTVDLRGVVSTPVTIIGGDGDDSLLGGDGNDSLVGGSGNDNLAGLNGADNLDGGDGDDRMWGDAGDDTLLGGAGNDFADGGAGNDQLHGLAGNDTLIGGAGDDALAGQEGNDKLYGRGGYDRMWGDAGDDFLDAGSAYEQTDGGAGKDFNAHVTAVNGTVYTDIVQGGGPTCWVLSGLAGATRTGALDLSTRIEYRGESYLGGVVYRVHWLRKDGKGQMYQDVQFDGTPAGADPVTDERGGAWAESWVVIYQRAILQQAGRSIDDSGSGGTYHEPPLYLGRDAQPVSPTNKPAIVAALDAGKAVMANIPAGNAMAAALGLPAWHWYAVLHVRPVGGTYEVVLYNPHGHVRTVTWGEFTAAFDAVSIV